jgi:hypothetical protein
LARITAALIGLAAEPIPRSREERVAHISEHDAATGAGVKSTPIKNAAAVACRGAWRVQ